MVMLGCLRPVWSLLKVLLLISLPVTFFPFLNGLFEGAFAAKYLRENEYNATTYFRQDIEAKQFAEYLSVAGAPGVVDSALPPFHVVRLQDPTDWWERVGLVRPEFDKETYPPYGTDDPYKFPALTGLYKRASASEESNPWHHWVYASAQVLHFEGRVVDEWDNAFEELIRYHYANGSAEFASFHYISCPHSFLCASWRVKGPALLHFTTEESELSKFALTTEDKEYPDHDPINVRIIEFPIKEPGELGIPGVFPSYFNQLRAVTATPSAWKMHESYSDVGQVIRRIVDICRESAIAHTWTYGLLVRWEKAVMRVLGFEDAVAPLVARAVGIFLSGGARFIGYKALHKTSKLLGYEEIERPKSSGDAEAKTLEEQLSGLLEDLADLGGESVSEGDEIWGVLLDAVKAQAEQQANEEEHEGAPDPS
ncbi:hypothetical protein QQZ08_001805 [Neonectria magnoliae]|uniref:Uncharacterized protein n=1 Tax=Neonectria magnoliae TaxID=2732573 RepID=A0ABR1IF37_9HYPO